MCSISRANRAAQSGRVGQQNPKFLVRAESVFNQSCELLETLRDKNRLLDAANMSFKLARADGTKWYAKMRYAPTYKHIHLLKTACSDEEYAKPLHITLGLQFHVSVPS